VFHDDDPFFQRLFVIDRFPPDRIGIVVVVFDTRKRTRILHTIQQHAARRIIHAIIPYGNIFFFGIVYTHPWQVPVP